MNVFNATSSHQKRRDALALLPRKQVILFAAEAARLVLPIWDKAHPEDKRPLEAILAAESFDRERARKAADAAYAAAYDAASAHAAAYAAYDAASAHAAANAANAAHAAYAAYAAAYAAAHAAYATKDSLWPTLQALFDSAYMQGKPFSPQWRTRETLSLALAITTERDYSVLPILQDALTELSCEVNFFPPYGNHYWALFNLLHAEEK